MGARARKLRVSRPGKKLGTPSRNAIYISTFGDLKLQKSAVVTLRNGVFGVLTTISTCVLAHFLGVVWVCLTHPILLVARAVLRVHVLTVGGLIGWVGRTCCDRRSDGSCEQGYTSREC